jgi:RNA polymerase sigma factor (sigma-70 family)
MAELDDAGRELVIQYRSLAKSLAWRYLQKAPAGDLDELNATAFEALCRAVARYPSYCAERGFDVNDTSYVAAYLMRSIQGRLLDVARQADWLTRTSRTIEKQLAEAEGLGMDRAGQARHAGVSLEEADRVRAEQAARPSSLEEATDADAGGYGAAAADETADTESSAVVSSVLGAAVKAIGALDGHARWILALTEYYELSLDKAAAVLGLDAVKAAQLHESATLAIYDSMLLAAS